MNNALPIVIVAGLIGLVIFIGARRRKKKSSPLVRLREGIEGALDDAEQRTHELRERARKVRGNAKKRLDEQVHEMEDRQKELRGKLNDLKAEAGKLLERARP